MIWAINDGKWIICDEYGKIVITNDQMTELVKAWCEDNGLPFPWGGCVPEHDEIKAAEEQK